MRNRIDKKYLKSTAYELKFRVIRDQSRVHTNLLRPLCYEEITPLEGGGLANRHNTGPN